MLKNFFKSIVDVIPKTVGFVADKALDLVDTVLPIFDPALKTLSAIPFVGTVLDNTLSSVVDLVSGTSTELHVVSDKLSEGSIIKAVDAVANGVFHTVGNTVDSVTVIANSVVDLTKPVTNLTDDIPIIGNILNSVTDTAHNVVSFVSATGTIVNNVDISQTIAQVITEPFVSIGELIEDTANHADLLLNTIDPILNLTNKIPVVNSVVDAVENTADLVIKGIYSTGPLFVSISTGIDLPDLPYVS